MTTRFVAHRPKFECVSLDIKAGRDLDRNRRRPGLRRPTGHENHDRSDWWVNRRHRSSATSEALEPIPVPRNAMSADDEQREVGGPTIDGAAAPSPPGSDRAGSNHR